MATWRVTGQRQYEELTANGQFVAVVEVTYELIQSGTQGSVKVPARAYTEDNVRNLVDQSAQAMAAVENLSG